MSADVDAHVTALRHMAAEDLHLPSVAGFIEALAAERDAAVQRAEAAEASRDQWLLTYHSTREHLNERLTEANARAAVAWEEGVHYGIDIAANRYQVCASPDMWDYFYAAENAMLDLKSFKHTPPADHTAALDAHDQRVRDAEWNKAIEAAAEKCDVATMDHIGDMIRGIGDDIRALRREAGEA